MTRGEVLLFSSVAALVTGVAVAVALPGRAPELRFFDIGQGDAVLVQQGSIQMLVDGGPDANVLAKLGEAMPFFDRTIEMIVSTHPDKDHFGGLTDVLSRYRVGTVVVDGETDAGPTYERFADALAASGARFVVARTGDTLRLNDRVSAEVVWPRQGYDTDAQNDMSVVLRVMVDGVPAALLTGDATSAVEPMMPADSVAAPVLKVGHHGSAYSTSRAFIDAVDPGVAVISVGAHNAYGHPAGAVLHRLSSRGVPYLRTDTAGDVRLSVGSVMRVCTGPTVPFLAHCVAIEGHLEQIRPASYTDANSNDI